MSTAGRHDVWASGDPYERFIGRWSRLVAPEFLAWLGLARGLDWLDVGSGTGALSRTILDLAAPKSVTGVEPSSAFLEHARTHVVDPRVRFEAGDARSLPVEASSVDVAVAGLVLHFVPEPARGAQEMMRATRAGGTVAAYVWDYADRMDLLKIFWSAASELDPAAQDLDEGPRFPLCKPEALAALFVEMGLADVETRAIDVPTVFRDFDDYWSPFLGGQGPAPGYAMALDEARRTALRERIRSKLPIAEDGSIALIARAWAVRGRVG